MKLEDITEKDREDIIRLTKLKSVMQYVGNGKIWDSDKVDRFIGYNLKEVGSKDRREYYYKITDSKFVGIIGVHPFLSFKGYYLSVMILPEEQRKGYYRKSIIQLSERIKKEGIKTDRIKILVRTNNQRMISLSEKNYYFNRQRQIKNESFYEFFYFLRKYSYLFLSSNTEKRIVKSIFDKRGNWEPFNEKKYRTPDYLYIYGDYKFYKKFFNMRSLLKNVSDYGKGKITNKRLLFENLQKIPGGEKYLSPNYHINAFHIDYQKVEKMFQKDKPMIFKPVHGLGGFGVQVVRDFEDFQQLTKNTKFLDDLKNVKEGRLSREKISEWVLQEYINSPLLLKGKKFHIRLYFLVYHNLKYLLKKGLIFTANKKYKQEDYHNKDIHDTHSYEKTVEQVMKYPEDLSFLGKEKNEKIWKQIMDLFSKIGKIEDFDCYPESKDCYRVTGADVMITEDLKVKIIEINENPGLPTIKSDFGRMIFENEMNLIVDSVFPPQNKIEEDNDFIQV